MSDAPVRPATLLWRRLRPWVAVSIALVGLLIIVRSSRSFHDCIHDHKNDKEYEALHKRTDVMSTLIMRPTLRLRLGAFCAADFTDKNERAITALAGVALALVTLYLWRATHGLRQYAGIQARDMRQLLTAARDNANAAGSQAEAMGQLYDAMREQAKATAENVRLAERALVLAQRPRIKVREIEPDFTVNHEWYFQEGEPVTGGFWIGNAGGSQAIVNIWRCHVWWSQRGLPPAWPNIPPFHYDGSDDMPTLTAGAHSLLRFQSAETMGKEGHDISTGRGDWRLYVFGRVTYADELGIMRTTAFCRRFHKAEGETGRFVRVDDTNLEYED
jgi:hypothetical protein